MRAAIPLAALLLLPVAAAQSACPRDDPCVWAVTVDGDGLDLTAAPADGWSWAAGDWVVLRATNLDAADHVLESPGVGLRLVAPAEDQAQSPPVQLVQPGNHTLLDLPSNTAAPFRVEPVEADDAAAQDGGASTREARPAAAAGWLALAALGLASGRARRA